ncbi:hypothetical protein [Rhodopseudomonas palustris]|uniref:hypothetical protein n=1 Tax=Rhodopseudomonas palustris TaxID=1076 RepID=UPI0021F33B83|nr:hypothetical protein [Rhodopseudomonas palustris]UYO55190.1 hypothetical protein KQX61_07245 [Rhodopseudomonas palustris]
MAVRLRRFTRSKRRPSPAPRGLAALLEPSVTQRRRNLSEEHDDQVALFRDWIGPSLIEGAIAHANANGGWRLFKAGKALRVEGATAGVPDIMIVARGPTTSSWRGAKARAAACAKYALSHRAPWRSERERSTKMTNHPSRTQRYHYALWDGYGSPTGAGFDNTREIVAFENKADRDAWVKKHGPRNMAIACCTKPAP